TRSYITVTTGTGSKGLVKAIARGGPGVSIVNLTSMTTPSSGFSGFPVFPDHSTRTPIESNIFFAWFKPAKRTGNELIHSPVIHKVTSAARTAFAKRKIVQIRFIRPSSVCGIKPSFEARATCVQTPTKKRMTRAKSLSDNVDHTTYPKPMRGLTSIVVNSANE